MIALGEIIGRVAGERAREPAQPGNQRQQVAQRCRERFTQHNRQPEEHEDGAAESEQRRQQNAGEVEHRDCLRG